MRRRSRPQGLFAPFCGRCLRQPAHRQIRCGPHQSGRAAGGTGAARASDRAAPSAPVRTRGEAAQGRIAPLDRDDLTASDHHHTRPRASHATRIRGFHATRRGLSADKHKRGAARGPARTEAGCRAQCLDGLSARAGARGRVRTLGDARDGPAHIPPAGAMRAEAATASRHPVIGPKAPERRTGTGRGVARVSELRQASGKGVRSLGDRGPQVASAAPKSRNARAHPTLSHATGPRAKRALDLRAWTKSRCAPALRRQVCEESRRWPAQPRERAGAESRMCFGRVLAACGQPTRARRGA